MSSVSGRRPGIGMWRMVAALVRQRRRLALATLAVALSVGYLAGALTLLDRVSEGLSDLAAAGAERADFIVEGDVAYESSLEQTRRLIPSSIGQSLEGQPGIAAVVPRVEEITMLLGPDMEPIVAPGLSEQPLGTNWPTDEAISPYRFVGDGRAPTAADEVVIDARSARAADVSVGDKIVVAGKTKVAPYQVVGIVTTAEGDLPSGSSLALFSTDEARLLFDTPDNDNRLAIRLTDDADPGEVASRIRAQLPPGAILVDGPTGAMHRQESLTRSFALIRVLIMGFAGLALVVGMVTVANSLTLLYSERRHTFATFRLVGAKPRQLLAVALTEAAMLAGVASLIGAPLGLLLGRLIEMVLGALGTSIPVGGSVVSISALVLAVVVGSVATVLAAILPAWRACRVDAIEAIVESESARSTTVMFRLTRASILAVAVAAIVWGFLLIADIAPGQAPVIALSVAAVIIVGFMLPTALSYAVAAGIRAVPTRSSALRRIGARDAVRNRTRTAATTGALLLATGVVAGLAVFLSSFAAAIDSDVGDLVRSDLVIDSGTFTRGGLPGDLLTQVAALPDVEAVSGWQVGRANIGQVPVRLTGIDGEALADELTPTWVGAPPTSLSTDGVLLSEKAANQIGAAVGDTVPVTFTSQGVEILRVEGIYATGALLLGEAVLDRQVLTRQVPASVDLFGLVSLNPDDAAARQAVVDLASSYGVSSVLEPSEFVNSRADLLRGFERVIQWMLLFTLVQALVGVVNTLLLSVGERRREFGLLRAAGASRRQVLRLVLVEGTSFAVIGTVLGLVVGVALARVAVGSLGKFGISGFVVPIPILVVTGIAAAGLGILAAIIPARWAAAVPPLEAVMDSGGASSPLRRSRRWGRRRSQDVSDAATGVDHAWVPVASDVSDERRTTVPPRYVTPADSPAAAPVPAAPAPAAPAPAAPAPPVTAAPPVVVAPLVSDMPAAAREAAAEPMVGQLPPPVVPGHIDAPPAAAPAAPPAAEPAAASAAEVPVADTPAAADSSDRQMDEREIARSWLRAASPPARRGPSTPPRSGAHLFAPAGEPAAQKARSGRGARSGPTNVTPTPPREAVEPVIPSDLVEALAALDPLSVRDAEPTFEPLIAAMRPGEHVHHVVQGWTRGLPCLVVRTDQRVLVIVSRFPEPLVESLHPTRTVISLYGPPGTNRVSLAVVDGRRLLEVTGIRDGAQAAAMRSAPQPQGAGDGYF